ncbi:MAG: glycosyltransferase [Anaerolineae bacterium]|nr:glycosyltransferase [Anaerolineae bacterium]
MMVDDVQQPMFSVIVPTYNRPAALVACLESLAQMAYPAGAWELIVVNDGGQESFTAVTEQLKNRLPLHLLTVAHNGPAAARNAGAQRAQGEYLAFTDDDCQVTPDWLQAFAAGFADGRWQALGGQTVSPFLQNRAERAWQHLTDFLNLFMQDDAANALLLISNNVAYRRATFAKLGGFNETFPLAAAEDMELSYRLLAAGYRQSIWPEAKVWHYHHLSAWGHVRQQFRYGRGGYYFNQALAENPSAQLRPLYLNEAFLPSLRQSMRRAGLPYMARGMVLAGQYAYKVGLRYQTWRAQMGRDGL